MGTPDNKSATPETPSVEQGVKDLVAQITTDDDGNFVFPEGIEASPELKFAATAEKRRRDTQSDYTKGRKASKSLEAENEELRKLLGNQAKVELSKEDQDRLEILKDEDPDAWRIEINKLENEASIKSRANLDGLTGEAKKAAEDKFELDRRQQVLEEFNESAETPITEELIANEVPPRITKKLAEGTITFEEFLLEVTIYVGKGKVVKNEDTLDQPNLGDLGGGKTPDASKADQGLEAKYSDDTY